MQVRVLSISEKDVVAQRQSSDGFGDVGSSPTETIDCSSGSPNTEQLNTAEDRYTEQGTERHMYGASIRYLGRCTG